MTARASLLYCFDEGYAAASIVSAHSALDHASAPLVVHFTHDGPIDRMRPMIDRLATHPRCADLHLRPLSFPEHVGQHVGQLLRVYCGRLLARPPKGGRVLYIDGDTVIQSDLVPLAEHDLGQHPIGAVQDTMFLTWHHKSQSNDPRRRRRYQKTLARWSASMTAFNADQYFNSGVLLLDYDRIDALGFTAAMHNLDRVADLRLPDQDYLNELFAGHVAWLDPKWNAQWGNIETRRGSIPAQVRHQWAQSRRNPAILHFIGKPKPWHPLNAKEFVRLLGLQQIADLGRVLAMRRAYAKARARAAAHLGMDPFGIQPLKAAMRSS